MDQALSELDRVTLHLLEEIEVCHTQIVDLHRHAQESGSTSARYETSKAIARLMQSQAGAMVALKRMRGDGSQHTFTFVHQGNTPTPKKLKTNAPESAQ